MFSRKAQLNKLFLVTALVVSFASGGPTPGRQTQITAGEVTEKIATQSEPDQSYAIYLPPTYSPKQKWPTIFCFDPGARGKFAVERFKAAAEKFGYIVACSNNSRNGLDSPAVTKIVTAFWNDVHQRLPVDEQRRYFAGFSGGARLSIGLALRCNGCVAGVIAAGAGFPGDQQPDANTKFDFVGAAGYDDFNHGELLQLENKLDDLKTPHRFYQFAGGHEWPPPTVFESALAWFDVQSMRRGTLPKDEKFLEKYYSDEHVSAMVMRDRHQLVEARSVYQALIRDFYQEKDRHVDDAFLEARFLLSSPELRKQLQQESELYRRQLKEANEIRTQWMKPRQPDEDLSSRAEAKSRISNWRKKKDAEEDSEERRLARRILSDVQIGCLETARAALRNKDYQTAIGNLQLVRIVDPKASNVAYDLARALALDNQKKTALESLEEAVSLGFKDLERMKTEPAFSSISSDTRFKKLTAKRSP